MPYRRTRPEHIRAVHEGFLPPHNEIDTSATTPKSSRANIAHGGARSIMERVRARGVAQSPSTEASLIEKAVQSAQHARATARRRQLWQGTGVCSTARPSTHL